MNTTKNEQEKIRELINDSYISWLKTFSEKHTCFFDDAWPTYPFDALENDKKNIKSLKLFYSLIDEYAKRSSFNTINSGCSYYYLLKIDNRFYEIGFITYPEMIFFCKNTIISKEDLFIDFIDIQNSCIQKDKIGDIKSNHTKPLLSKTAEATIPLTEMEQTVNKVLQKVKAIHK